MPELGALVRFDNLIGLIMLQTIREKLTGGFAVFILGAIALTLVISFGNIDTGFTGGTVAATVNGEEIPMQEFQRLYDRQRQEWESNFQEQLPNVMARTMADSVIQLLVNNRVVTGYVRASGYRVADTEVIDSIQSNTAFHVGGEFSRLAYEQYLQSQGSSSRRFEFDQRQNMQAQQFWDGIESSAFYTPIQFRRYIELDGESRSVIYTLLKADDWLEKVVLEADAIETYYNENPARFQTDEMVDLEYLEIDFNEMKESVSISDAEGKVYFAENSSEFRGPDDNLVSHILLPVEVDDVATLTLAVQLRDRIDSGEDFSELAREYSTDSFSANKGGELGWLGVGEEPAAEFAAALVGLQPGEVSAPVKTEYGYHLIKLIDVRANDKITYDSVRDELLTRMRENQAIDLYDQQYDELDELSLESLDGLSSVASTMGLELQTLTGFGRNGSLPLGDSLDLVDIVFSLEVLDDGENSRVIELADGRAVVVRVVGHQLPELKPLEQVADAITALLRSNEAMLLAATAGNELVSQLDAGADPVAFAEENSTEWTAIEELRRGGQDLPADLSAAVFKAPPATGDDASEYRGLLLASGDYAIYQVTAINKGKPGIYGVEIRDQRKQGLAQQLGSSQLNAMIASLSESADTSVTDNLLGDPTELL